MVLLRCVGKRKLRFHFRRCHFCIRTGQASIATQYATDIPPGIATAGDVTKVRPSHPQ